MQAAMLASRNRIFLTIENDDYCENTDFTIITKSQKVCLTETVNQYTGCFFFLWIQSGGRKSAILRSFMLFLYFLHSKIWAHFHFGTFDPKE